MSGSAIAMDASAAVKGFYWGGGSGGKEGFECREIDRDRVFYSVLCTKWISLPLLLMVFAEQLPP